MTVTPDPYLPPQNNSKKPTLIMIELSSSPHTFTRSSPYHVTTTHYVKPLKNNIILLYTPKQQYNSVARWNMQQYWSFFLECNKRGLTRKFSLVKWNNIPRGEGLGLGINICERGVCYYTTKNRDAMGMPRIWGGFINYPGNICTLMKELDKKNSTGT